MNVSRRSLFLAPLAHVVVRAAQEVTFSTSVDLVTLLATVRNRDGGIVNDLNQNDFVLEEDGRPQTIRYFSRETGGRFFEVTKDQPIERIYAQIEEELRNQYSFGYTSDHQGGSQEYRKIKLTTKRSGLTVQTRAGYYPR